MNRLILISICCASAFYAQSEAVKKVKFRVEPFAMQEVRLSDGPFKDLQEANHRYLLLLDAERLLHNHRVFAGLPSEAEPLGGCDTPQIDIRGHFTGHYLSACALMYASTGDEELKKKGAYIVGELAKCQKALGGEYLSAFPESFFDRLEKGEAMWASYYVIHKMLAGLYDQYSLCDNQQAIEIMKGMASYFQKRISKVPDDVWSKILAGHEQGGFGEAIYNLYSATGEANHLWLAKKFDQDAFIDPLAAGQDNLSSIHANTNIPIIVSAARGYEVTGERRYQKTAINFWDFIVNKRSYVTGGTSKTEWLWKPEDLAESLCPYNQEFCTSYNMQKLTRHLFCWTGDLRYADYYERMLINSVLEAFNPDDAMVSYFTPMTIGCSKGFSSDYHSFWCCTGTGVEALSMLGNGIYFHDNESIYINTFISSALDWKEKGIRIEQKSRFPEEQAAVLAISVESATKFALKIRIPHWASHGITLKINGKEQDSSVSQVSYYLTIERDWKNGDLVELSFPMSLYAQSIKGDSDIVSFMYGPVVLAGMVQRDKYVNDAAANNVPIAPSGGPLNDWYLLADAKNLRAWLEPVENQPLTFVAHGINRQISFKPLYKTAAEPYGMYWLALKDGSPRHKAILKEIDTQKQREQRRVVDRVVIGNNVSEAEHDLKGASHVNYQAGRACREGGTWSWRLKALPDAQMTLLCTYFAGDHYGRYFDIAVEGQIVGTLLVQMSPPSKFVEVEYAIPLELTKDKDAVTIEFRPRENCSAGPIYGIAMMKPVDYIPVGNTTEAKAIMDKPPLMMEEEKQEAKTDSGLSQNPQRTGAPKSENNDN